MALLPSVALAQDAGAAPAAPAVDSAGTGPIQAAAPSSSGAPMPAAQGDIQAAAPSPGVAPVSDPAAPGSAQAAGQQPADEMAKDVVLRTPCVQPNAVAAYKDMADLFAADPQGFMDGYTQRGTSVAVPVRNILVINPQAALRFLDFAKADVLSAQARQIAIGMGQATAMCAKSNPAVALRFQQLIAGIAEPSIRQAFLAATGDLATAALGRAGGGAAPAGAPSIAAGPTTGTFTNGVGNEVTQQEAPSSSGRSSTVSLTITESGSGDDGSSARVVSPVTP